MIHRDSSTTWHMDIRIQKECPYLLLSSAIQKPANDSIGMGCSIVRGLIRLFERCLFGYEFNASILIFSVAGSQNGSYLQIN